MQHYPLSSVQVVEHSFFRWRRWLRPCWRVLCLNRKQGRPFAAKTWFTTSRLLSKFSIGKAAIEILKNQIALLHLKESNHWHFFNHTVDQIFEKCYFMLSIKFSPSSLRLKNSNNCLAHRCLRLIHCWKRPWRQEISPGQLLQGVRMSLIVSI